jgi:hypothetical protein
MGNTEFLLPEGVMVPERGWPPLTIRSDIDRTRWELGVES